MNPANTRMREQDATDCIIPFTSKVWTGKFKQTESRCAVAGEQSEKREGVSANGLQLTFENAIKLDSANDWCIIQTEEFRKQKCMWHDLYFSCFLLRQDFTYSRLAWTCYVPEDDLSLRPFSLYFPSAGIAGRGLHASFSVGSGIDSAALRMHGMDSNKWPTSQAWYLIF